MYYCTGLRIKTNVDVGIFVDIWANKKYDNDKENPFTKKSRQDFEVVAQSTQLNNMVRPRMEQLLSEYKPSWFYMHQAMVIAYSCMVPAP